MCWNSTFPGSGVYLHLSQLFDLGNTRIDQFTKLVSLHHPAWKLVFVHYLSSEQCCQCKAPSGVYVYSPIVITRRQSPGSQWHSVYSAGLGSVLYYVRMKVDHLVRLGNLRGAFLLFVKSFIMQPPRCPKGRGVADRQGKGCISIFEQVLTVRYVTSFITFTADTTVNIVSCLSRI